MTTPNLFALMGRLEELLQNEKRYLALRRSGRIREYFPDIGVYEKLTPEQADKFCDKLIEEQGDIQDE